MEKIGGENNHVQIDLTLKEGISFNENFDNLKMFFIVFFCVIVNFLGFCWYDRYVMNWNKFLVGREKRATRVSMVISGFWVDFLYTSWFLI